MQIGDFFQLLLQALSLVVIADAILSWVVPSPSAVPRNITSAISGPLCAPFRAILKPEKLGGIDISPLLVIFTLNALARAAAQLTYGV